MTVMIKWLVAVLTVVCFSFAARADSCNKSLDYILNDFAGELPRPAIAYQGLLKVCLQTLTIANVKDAYVLRDGGIAVIPKNDSIFATASMLSEFCRKFPRGTLRFITRREVRRGFTTGLIVLMSSANTSSCRKIWGEM